MAVQLNNWSLPLVPEAIASHDRCMPEVTLGPFGSSVVGYVKELVRRANGPLHHATAPPMSKEAVAMLIWERKQWLRMAILPKGR
jgi:hypothetical protein